MNSICLCLGYSHYSLQPFHDHLISELGYFGDCNIRIDTEYGLTPSSAMTIILSNSIKEKL